MAKQLGTALDDGQSEAEALITLARLSRKALEFMENALLVLFGSLTN